MTYPASFDGFEPLTEEEARRAVYLAVLLELRYLGWARWRKGMSAADVLKQTGVDEFATRVTNRLTGAGVAMLKSPPVPVRIFEVPPQVTK
jgi:hypothetical protein